MASNAISLEAAAGTAPSTSAVDPSAAVIALPQALSGSQPSASGLGMDAAAQQAMLSPSSNQAAYTLRQQISLMAAVHNAAAALTSGNPATSTFPLLAAAASNPSLPTHPALMSLTSVQSSVLEPYVAAAPAAPQGNVYSSPATLYESAAAASFLAAAAVTSQAAATATTGGHPPHSYLLSCPFNVPAPPNATAPQPCTQHRYGAAASSAALLNSSLAPVSMRASHTAMQQASSSTAQQPLQHAAPSISANASVSVQYRGPARIMKRPAGYGTATGPSTGHSMGSYQSTNSSSAITSTDEIAATSSRAPKLRRITSFEDASTNAASIAEQQPAAQQLAHNAALLESRQVVSSMAELVAAVSEAAANAAVAPAAAAQQLAAAAPPYIAAPCPVCVACQQHLPTTAQHCSCLHHHHHCHHSVCSICSAAGNAAAAAAAAQAGFSSDRPVPSPAGTSSLAGLAQPPSAGAASTVANATALVNTLQQIQQQAQQQASNMLRSDVHSQHSALLASRYAQQEREQQASNMWYQRQQQSLQTILRLQPQPVIMFPARHHHHHPSTHPMMEFLVLHPGADLVLNGTAHPNPATAHAAQHGAPEPQPVGATPDQIKKHTTVLSYVKDPTVPEQERERCTVCLMDFETGDDLRTLNCSHLFHVDCIDRWLQYNKKCPVCRVDMDKLSAPLVMDAASIST